MSHILTLIVDLETTVLTDALVERVRDAVGAGPADILSPGEAVDLPVAEPPDPAAVEAALDGAAVDAITIAAVGRRKRLLIADMDSTIVTGETLDELAAEAGVKSQIAAITRRSMNGEIDFAEALRARVAMLKGLKLAALEHTWGATRMTPGATELVATMRAHGAITALVSGGFTWFTTRVAQHLGFDLHRANILIDDGECLTGEVGEPILDRNTKRETLLELSAQRGIPLAKTLAVGDGANDLEMLRIAGLGVAFRAKPVVEQATQAKIKYGNLRGLLFVQGYRLSEIKKGK